MERHGLAVAKVPAREDAREKESTNERTKGSQMSERCETEQKRGERLSLRLWAMQ